MYDVPITINHDISIVAILNLENITSHGVCSHGLNKVQLCFLKSNSILASIFGSEKVQQIVDLSPTHFIARGSIRNHIYDTTLCKELSLTFVVESQVLTPGAVAVTRYGNR